MPLIGFVVLIAAGCNAHMSVEDYSHAWRAQVLSYRALDKQPDLAPADSGETPEQAGTRAALAVAEQLHKIARDLNELDAPESLHNLHEQTFLFYQGQADDFQIYAEALQSRDQGRIQAAVEEINAYVDEHQTAVLREIHRLGSSASLFEGAWAATLKPLSEKERARQNSG